MRPAQVRSDYCGGNMTQITRQRSINCFINRPSRRRVEAGELEQHRTQLTRYRSACWAREAALDAVQTRCWPRCRRR